MSFAPLPMAFQQRAAHWAALPVCRLVDLGCGQGEVADWLEPHGLSVLGLDQWPRAAGTRLDIQGDALQPPLLESCLDGLLAANLMHHALAQDPTGEFLERWLGLLNPTGWLFLLGDQIGPHPDPAEQNYHKLQAFLAEIMPGRRGPLVSGQQVVGLLEGLGARNLRWGVETNGHKLDENAVVAMLAGTGERPEHGPADRLARSIRRHGLSLGSFWWLEAQGPQSS